MAEGVKNVRVVFEEAVVFEDDQGYLDGYSMIVTNFIEHYNMWQCLREGRLRKGGVRKKDDEEYARQRLPELNRALQVQEWLFWEKVNQSLRAGKTFFLEEFAAHYRLGHFEKRAFLLCLCGELSGEEGFSMSIPTIVNMLNLDNSVSGKVKNIAYLNKEMPLLKQGILAPAYKFDTRDYKISGVFLELISKILNGGKIEWPKIEEAEVADPDGPESVGFVKNPEQAMDEVILKDDMKEKVRLFLDVYKSDKFHEFGADKTIKNSKGLTFLFYGPPGTGKTMLAEAIARSVGKKLLIAETPKIFNMWLGETDKKIHAMFKIAREYDLVLLIDEADSLIYSRELASSDLKIRFVNLMLTELERFEGIAILTTNMDQVLDNALERRIALKVQFELPSCERRAQIWKNHIPPAFGLEAIVNINELARIYEFSGGNIKNAVLTAIRRAIFRNDKMLTMEDLVFGADVEKEGMLSVKNGPKVIKGFSV